MRKIGVSLLALGLVLFFTVPAMAASITPYASMRLGTFYTKVDFNDDTPGYTTDDDDCDLNFDIARISRFGAKGQVGDIYGRVELGFEGSENYAGYNMSSSTHEWYNRQVYARLLYAKWDFGGGNLLVGQDYTPPTYPSAQQGPGIFDLQNSFISVGCLWDRRWPQIKVTMDNGFYAVAATTYDGEDPAGNFHAPANTVSGGDVDVDVPKLFVGYDYKAEGIYIGPGFGYNTYDYDDTAVGGTFDDDVTSWVLFLKGALDLDAVSLKFAAHYGENLGDFGILGRTNCSMQIDANGDTEDSEMYGGYVQASFNVDPGKVSLGWGYSSAQNDAYTTTDEDDEKMGYFVNWKIPITDNFTVTPEFDYWDGMEDCTGTDDADQWNLGLLWQADF